MARLLLWDVDGTLIHTAGIGAAVFDSAFEQVLGMVPESRIRLSGKTDPQIALEYLELMAVDDPHHQLPAVLEAVETEVAAAAKALASKGRVLPGMPGVLERLAGIDGVRQTLLTGNTMANAAVKITAFGLEKWLDLEIGAYGSDHADRRQLVPIARQRALHLRGVAVEPGDVWVIGDTGNDLACARAGGAKCLLVATGGWSYDDLEPLGADALLPDLSDTEAVLEILLSGDSRRSIRRTGRSDVSGS